MKSNTSLDKGLLSSMQAEFQRQHWNYSSESAPPSAPFITISRQAGAGAMELAQALEQKLNSLDPAQRPWTTWDRELLVQKVSQEQHLPADVVEQFEKDSLQRNWLTDFLAGLSPPQPGADLDEYQLFRRVAKTVRALALAGRCILVGRGGVYATGDLPGGIHVRLIAPLEHRIALIARLKNLSQKEASLELQRIDRHRDEFHRRFFGAKALLPEIFTIAFNSAKVDDQTMADCILPLVRRVAVGQTNLRGEDAAR